VLPFPAPPQGRPSAPNQNGTVPNVVGQPLQRAERALRAAGYTRITINPVNANAPRGQVVAQSPPGGTQADPANTTVVLNVVNVGGGGGGGNGGGGNGIVAVPALIGLTEGAAQSALSALGLAAAVLFVMVINQAQVGRVLAQSPTAGTTVAAGSTVTITVGRLRIIP